MSPDFRALCAELLQPLAEYDSANPYHEHRDLITRARAALAKSQPPATAPLPTGYIDPEHRGEDLRLLQAFYEACNAEGGTADEIHLRGIRAALAIDRTTLAQQGSVTVPGAQRDAVIAAVTEALGNAYDCLRVWEAWGVGTMGEDDFELIAENGERVVEIADAAIEAMRLAAPPATAPLPTGYIDPRPTDEEINEMVEAQQHLSDLGDLRIGVAPEDVPALIHDALARWGRTTTPPIAATNMEEQSDA